MSVFKWVKGHEAEEISREQGSRLSLNNSPSLVLAGHIGDVAIPHRDCFSQPLLRLGYGRVTKFWLTGYKKK